MATAAAVGHFGLTAGVFKRSKGQSAVAASAYRARCEMTDERTGENHDYTRAKNKALFSGFYAPANAPEWAKDRGQFWNAVEKFEKRKDAQLARDLMIELPHQLSVEHARFALQNFTKELTRQGYAVQIDIHAAHEHGDERNLHAHLMVALRKLEKDGQFGAKEQFNGRGPDKMQLIELRENAAKHINRQLEIQGYGLQVDHRSYADRGIEREAAVHFGKAAAAMERRGVETEIGRQNIEIEARNLERAREDEREAAEERHVLEELHKIYGPEIILDDHKPEHVPMLEELREAERDEERQQIRRDDARKGLLTAIWQLTRTMGQSLSHVILGADRGELIKGRSIANDDRQAKDQQVHQVERNDQAKDQVQRQVERNDQAKEPPAKRETYLERQKRLARERGEPEKAVELERFNERQRRKSDDPRYG